MKNLLCKWLAPVAAVLVIGCGSGAEPLETVRSAANVVPEFIPPTEFPTCETLGLAGARQDTFGIQTGSVVPAWQISFPRNYDSGSLTMEFAPTHDAILSWSTQPDLVVYAMIVRSRTTGAYAYFYPGGATSDAMLTPPAPGEVDSVKLCYGFEAEETGCTLTQGYWKTHSSVGPASKVDPTWATLGESTEFFDSGMTYLAVLQAVPKKGNAFFILAHQYIAAKLNTLAGASMGGAVRDAFDAATELFEGLAADATTIPESSRARAVELAGILEAYNEGDVGPGHCD